MNEYVKGFFIVVLVFVILFIMQLWLDMIHDISVFVKDKYAKWKEDMRNDPITFWKTGKPCAAGGCAISASGRSTPCPAEQNTVPGFVNEIKMLNEDTILFLDTGYAVNLANSIVPSLIGNDTRLSGFDCADGELQDFLLSDIVGIEWNGEYRDCKFYTELNRFYMYDGGEEDAR